MDELQKWIESLNGLQLFGVITGAASLASTAITFGLNMLMKRAERPRVEWTVAGGNTRWVVHEGDNVIHQARNPEEEPRISIRLVNTGTAPARKIRAYTSGAYFGGSDMPYNIAVGEGFWITAICYPRDWENAHFVIEWSENRLLSVKPKRRYIWINFQEKAEAPFPVNERDQFITGELRSELLARHNPDWPHQERRIPPATRRKEKRRAERTMRSKTSTLR